MTFTPTHGILIIVPTVGITLGGTTIMVGTVLGGGILPIIGIPTGTILGGVGTDIIIPFITLCGIRTMAVITTIIILHARSIAVPSQAIVDTAPAQSVAHVRQLIVVPARTAIACLQTATTVRQIATLFLLTVIQEPHLRQQFRRAETNARNVQ